MGEYMTEQGTFADEEMVVRGSMNEEFRGVELLSFLQADFRSMRISGCRCVS